MGTHAQEHRRTRGKRIGRRGRPRKIVPHSCLLLPSILTLNSPTLCCNLLEHRAQLDRRLGMQTGYWLDSNLHLAPDVDVVDLFLPVHPELDPHHSLPPCPGPTTSLAIAAAVEAESAEKSGMVKAMEKPTGTMAAHSRKLSDASFYIY